MEIIDVEIYIKMVSMIVEVNNNFIFNIKCGVDIG